MHIHLLDAITLFCVVLLVVLGCIGVVWLLQVIEDKFNRTCSVIVGGCLFFLLCVFLTALPTKAAQLHEYEVYYPNTCTFMNGRVEIAGQGIYRNYHYQVTCKEGGDISTYVSAPMRIWETPARVNHIPSNIKGYIYVKNIK